VPAKPVEGEVVILEITKDRGVVELTSLHDGSKPVGFDAKTQEVLFMQPHDCAEWVSRPASVETHLLQSIQKQKTVRVQAPLYPAHSLMH
jgi:hypothetical protein